MSKIFTIETEHSMHVFNAHEIAAAHRHPATQMDNGPDGPFPGCPDSMKGIKHFPEQTEVWYGGVKRFITYPFNDFVAKWRKALGE